MLGYLHCVRLFHKELRLYINEKLLCYQLLSTYSSKLEIMGKV